jgi:hypothetical protein
MDCLQWREAVEILACAARAYNQTEPVVMGKTPANRGVEPERDCQRTRKSL